MDPKLPTDPDLPELDYLDESEVQDEDLYIYRSRMLT